MALLRGPIRSRGTTSCRTELATLGGSLAKVQTTPCPLRSGEPIVPARSIRGYPGLSINSRILGGALAIRGTRIPVGHISACRRAGVTTQEILTYYPHVRESQAAEAARNDEEHRAEIDDELDGEERGDRWAALRCRCAKTEDQRPSWRKAKTHFGRARALWASPKQPDRRRTATSASAAHSPQQP